MDSNDKKIDEIFRNICENDGYYFNNNDSWSFYKDNSNIFKQLITDHELISKKDRHSKLPLTSKGYEVCKKGGFIKWKKKQKRNKTIKYIGYVVAPILLVLIAVIQMFAPFANKDNADNSPKQQIKATQQQTLTIQSQDSVDISKDILITDSLSNNLKD